MILIDKPPRTPAHTHINALLVPLKATQGLVRAVGEEVRTLPCWLIVVFALLYNISRQYIFGGGDYPSRVISAEARSVHQLSLFLFIRAGVYEFAAAAPGSLLSLTQRPSHFTQYVRYILGTSSRSILHDFLILTRSPSLTLVMCMRVCVCVRVCVTQRKPL